MVTLTGGTMFLMWLGEQITARGIGNGMSLIIFAGIVAQLPAAIAGTLELGRTGALSTADHPGRRHRRGGGGHRLHRLHGARPAPAAGQYPKRQVGNRMYGGEASHLPLKLNTSGVIPPIFASSLLLLPATVASFSANGGATGWLGTIAAYLGHGTAAVHGPLRGADRVLRFFYTAIVFNPTETADNLKKHGGFIPGIRPGKRTADFIDTC